jgi:alpha-amylase
MIPLLASLPGRRARRAPRVPARALAAFLSAAGCSAACGGQEPAREAPNVATAAPTASAPETFWNGATIYFLLTDRFANGDPDNDLALGRRRDGAVLRSFEGGDLKGLTERLDAGYFDSLGVTALWLTPFVEQIHGSVDEGTGRTYGFHGYWTRDWTAVDPALGTEDDLRALVDAAHRRGIRVLMDAVINHTGPVTPQDPQWPADWVRTGPKCRYQSYATTVDCTLVDNLPDVRTESDQPVELPPFLVDQWRSEGRLDREIAELDAFFRRTGYPRAPRYYLIKWLTDWVRELGIDGYRVDTAKHFGEAVSAELRREAEAAFTDWKTAHAAKVLDDRPFFMMGEVYGYALAHGRAFDFGDRSVDFYSHGYDALINFAFKEDARAPLDELFTRYAASLREGDLKGQVVVNYVSSHDDGGPYDRERTDPLGAGTRLLLAPGAAQIYYGDEVARPLVVAGADGDANLRSPMDWTEIGRAMEGGAGAQSAGTVSTTREVLEHWRKLGRFRRAHPAIGAGTHHRIQTEPYVFARSLSDGGRDDRVVVALDQPEGEKVVPVGGVFAEGTEVVDEYSGTRATVTDGRVTVFTRWRVVLLAAGE